MWPFFCRFEVDEVWRAIVTRKKTLRKLSAALLSAAMCFGFLIPVFAEGEGDNPSFAQTENMPVSNTEPSAGNTEISEPQSDASAAQGNPDPTSDQSTESPDAAADNSVQDAEESSDSSSSSDESTSVTDSKPSDSYSEADGEIGKEEIDSAEDANEKDGSSEEETPAKTVQFEKTADLIHVTAKTTSDILPEDAEMRVKLYSDQDEGFRAAENALNSSQVNYDGLLVVDVSFWKDEKEIEPEDGTVDVQMSFNKTLVDDEKTENSLQVHHISEKDGTKVEQVACESKQTIQDANETYKAEFKVDSFSSFTITWNRNDRVTATITFKGVDDAGKEISILDKPVSIDTKYSDTAEISAASLAEYARERAPEGYEYVKATTTIGDTKYVFDSVTLTRKRNPDRITANYCKDGGIVISETAYSKGNFYVELVYRKDNPDESVLRFDANGGSEAAPESITGLLGHTVTLPEYTGAKQGYRFLGWALARSLSSDTYYQLYQPGETYQLSTASQTLFAVWQNENPNITAEFYIRMDEKIPDEPGHFETSKYTKKIEVANALQEERWIVDNGHNGYVNDSEGNAVHANNAVTAKLNGLPKASDIKKKVEEFAAAEGNDAYRGQTFDPETEYVLWYVQKSEEEGQHWHVDGVILKKALVNVTYDKNCTDENVKTPLGYQKPKNTEIVIGSESNQTTIVTPVREGYVFLGWTEEQTPTSESKYYYNHDSYILSKDTVFYAQWRLDVDLLTVRKTVEGNLADRNQKFDFKVKVLDKDGNSYASASSTVQMNSEGWYEFKLSDSQQMLFTVPKGGSYQVQEAPAGYEPHYSIVIDTQPTITVDGKTDTGKNAFTGATTVTFRNVKQGTVPGGLHDDGEENSVLVTGGALGILALAACSLIFRKERDHEQR